ncbi:esterase/lipase family protein [Paeniglutamicibacter sp. NPDC091659]|uniref:esterase/lipase family protein n=1 Tax=Paeniglutamicibacter sp. NPDC091659 TaxID=3364389 RepID=UPI0037FF537B
MKRALRPWWWLLDYLYAGWRQLAAVFRREAPRSYAQGDPALPAIVLLPGVYETWLFLEPAAKRLNAAGHRVFAVPGLGINKRSIPESATIASKLLASLHAEHGVDRCLVVAHSKGGLIGKHLMLDSEAAGDHPVRILGLVAIGTPFSGSIYARYTLSRTIRHFSPTDAVLLSLKTQEALNDRVVSIYPEFDPHIPGGSALAGALNIEVPVSGHFRTLRSRAVLDAVDEAVVHLAGANGPNAGCS